MQPVLFSSYAAAIRKASIPSSRVSSVLRANPLRPGHAAELAREHTERPYVPDAIRTWQAEVNDYIRKTGFSQEAAELRLSKSMPGTYRAYQVAIAK